MPEEAQRSGDLLTGATERISWGSRYRQPPERRWFHDSAGNYRQETPGTTKPEAELLGERDAESSK
jgi:hypothetical protein